jgi:multiple sugar transport system ATP-binding protein
MARVILENLTKHFKAHRRESVRALTRLSLSVEDGEFMVLVGPSGCGKSTTLRLIAGLEQPDSGSIAIDGRAMDRVPPKDRDIAMVFQNHALFPHMTARENMAFGLMVRKCPRAEIEMRIGEAAEILGLNGCLDRRPEHLSGGERQRVALGRAIVRKTGVFLFDEPLSNLDAPLRAQLRREIMQLHERLRATMIFVTHDQMEAMTLGHRVAVLDRGELQQVAAPLEVYRRPANLFVAGFIGLPKMNLIEGGIHRNGRSTIFEKHRDSDAMDYRKDIELRVDFSETGRVARFRAGKVVLGIRPEHIAIFHGELVGHIPTIRAVAESVETAGADTYLYCRCGGQPLVMRLKPGENVPPGAKLNLTFDFSAASFFDQDTGKSLD